jgi:hypothetical protein
MLEFIEMPGELSFVSLARLVVPMKNTLEPAG